MVALGVPRCLELRFRNQKFTCFGNQNKLSRLCTNNMSSYGLVACLNVLTNVRTDTAKYIQKKKVNCCQTQQQLQKSTIAIIIAIQERCKINLRLTQKIKNYKMQN